MTITCEETNCIYNKLGGCTQNDLDIDADGQCLNCERFYETEEYQTPYWISVDIDKKRNVIGRFFKTGKMICINNKTFFTSDDTRKSDEYIVVTELKTGCACGLSDLKNNWENAMREVDLKPNVLSLPQAKFNPETSKYELINDLPESNDDLPETYHVAYQKAKAQREQQKAEAR